MPNHQLSWVSQDKIKVYLQPQYNKHSIEIDFSEFFQLPVNISFDELESLDNSFCTSWNDGYEEISQNLFFILSNQLEKLDIAIKTPDFTAIIYQSLGGLCRNKIEQISLLSIELQNVYEKYFKKKLRTCAIEFLKSSNFIWNQFLLGNVNYDDPHNNSYSIIKNSGKTVSISTIPIAALAYKTSFEIEKIIGKSVYEIYNKVDEIPFMEFLVTKKDESYYELESYGGYFWDKYVMIGEPILFNKYVYNCDYSILNSKKEFNYFQSDIERELEEGERYYYSLFHHAFFTKQFIEDNYIIQFKARIRLPITNTSGLLKYSKISLNDIDNSIRKETEDSIKYLLHNVEIPQPPSLEIIPFRQSINTLYFKLLLSSIVNNSLEPKIKIDQSEYVSKKITQFQNKDFGRLAEDYFNKYLIRNKSKITADIKSHLKLINENILDYRQPDLTFTWLNKNEESFKPYDFEVSIGSIIKIIVEVKSTRDRESKVLLSINELKYFSQLSKSYNYIILRVFRVESNEKFKDSNIFKIAPEYACLLLEFNEFGKGVIFENIDYWENFYNEKTISFSLDHFNVVNLNIRKESEALKSIKLSTYLMKVSAAKNFNTYRNTIPYEKNKIVPLYLFDQLSEKVKENLDSPEHSIGRARVGFNEIEILEVISNYTNKYLFENDN